MSPSLITAVAYIVLCSEINERDSRLGMTSCAFTLAWLCAYVLCICLVYSPSISVSAKTTRATQL